MTKSLRLQKNIVSSVCGPSIDLQKSLIKLSSISYSKKNAGFYSECPWHESLAQ